jgi:hypothetical protein
MSTLIAIDPGVHRCGWALFVAGKLVDCAYIPTKDIEVSGRTIIELPQIYRSSKSKGDPNDLIDIALVVGALLERSGGHAELVLPRKWKGTVPKKVMLKRIVSKLSEAEKRVLSNAYGATKSTLHNVTDSVGIGLWALKRKA